MLISLMELIGQIEFINQTSNDIAEILHHHVVAGVRQIRTVCSWLLLKVKDVFNQLVDECLLRRIHIRNRDLCDGTRRKL